MTILLKNLSFGKDNSLVTFKHDFTYDKESNFKSADQFNFDGSLVEFCYKDMIDCYTISDTLFEIDFTENALSFNTLNPAWIPEGYLKKRIDLAYVEINKLRTGIRHLITSLGERPSEFISVHSCVSFDMTNKLYHNEIKINLCYQNKCINDGFMIYISDFKDSFKTTLICRQYSRAVDFQKINQFSLPCILFEMKGLMVDFEKPTTINEMIDSFHINSMMNY